jgi:hypothetical protein
MTLIDAEIIDQNYEILFTGHYGRGKKQYVGASPATTCRFCLKSPPYASFKNEAHAVSELLGNRQLIVTDECDDCNTLFSDLLEDHLDKFTKPYRILGQVKGKNKIPSYKTPMKLSRIDVETDAKITIKDHQDDSFVELITAENRLKINFILERYVPAAVYKALVKMALSVMPLSELREFTITRRWIRHRDHTVPLISPLQVLVSFIPGLKPFVKTSIILLRKKLNAAMSDIPYCLFIIAFGNLQLQIMVPALSDRKNGDGPIQILMPRFPPPFDKSWSYGAPRPAIFDLTSGKSTEPRPYTMIMHYRKLKQ